MAQICRNLNYFDCNPIRLTELSKTVPVEAANTMSILNNELESPRCAAVLLAKSPQF